MSYRATPKDGGVSPAKAFLGREMRLAFMPNATVPMRQDEMAEEAAKAKRGPLRVGDKVVTRLPHVGKGLPQYSEQKQVERCWGGIQSSYQMGEMEFAQDQEDASGG